MNYFALPFVVSSLLNLTGVKNNSIVCEFNPTNKVNYVKLLTDFNDNRFILYEMDKSYAIYQVTDGEKLFLEGSYESNSIYSKYLDEELFYLGPGRYFRKKTDTTITDLFDNKSYDIQKFDKYGFQVKNENTYNISPLSSGPGNDFDPNTYVDTNGYRVIEYADYFKRLYKFPNNYLGTCGLVSLSMILTYLDTFYNDDFVENITYFYTKYNSETGEQTGAGSDFIIDKGEANFTTSSKAGLNIVKEMPGPTPAFHDYLFDKYMHYNPVFQWFANEGYPMADAELINTFNDYVSANCSHLSSNIKIESGIMFDVIGNIYRKINENVPIIAVVTQSFKPNGDKLSGGHDPIIYGYKDGYLLAHFGWRPGYTNYTTTILGSYTLYAYVSFEYTGYHKHSENITMKEGLRDRALCGCGFVYDIC